MILDILSSSLAALGALGTTAQIVAASTLVFDVAALVAVRSLLGSGRSAAPRPAENDFREAA